MESGVPLVIDRREGYFIYDVEGKRLIDVHLNGGTYNLGHRNPAVAAAVTAAMQHFDIGNHHFPSLARTALSEALVSTAPPGLSKVVFGSGGGEAIDIALKTARTPRKGAGSSRSPRPTTGTRASRWPPGTSVFPPCSTRPHVLASKIITMLDPQHAFLINRNKIGSMALAGESLFVLEMQPASYAILAANEAEKAARIKVVDYRMIGPTGRVYLSGSEADVRQAAEAAEDALRSMA